MMLQPRNFNFNTRQNLSSALVSTYPKLNYGTFALVLLRPLSISAKRIFRLKLFLKSSASRSDITNRAFWVSIFPHLPMSRKPKGMRMGNGAGNLSSWFTQIQGGRQLVEFNNLRNGSASYYSLQVSHKLPVPTSTYTLNTRNIRLVQSWGVNPDMAMFW